MNKSEVLATVGGPDRTQRWQGKDRWTYLLKKPDGEQLADIHFEGGKVVYTGDPPVPAVSAAEQDRLNEASNVRDNARVKAEIEQDRQSIRKRATQIQSGSENSGGQNHFEPIQ
jgi:outer membrane protein assembly factor BamE